MLSQEIAEVEEAGVKVNMCISDRATLCLPLHALEDALEEQRLGDKAYGSTRQGIAPAYGDRVMKKGILVGWLKQPEVLVETPSIHDGLETAATACTLPDVRV